MFPELLARLMVNETEYQGMPRWLEAGVTCRFPRIVNETRVYMTVMANDANKSWDSERVVGQ